MKDKTQEIPSLMMAIEKLESLGRYSSSRAIAEAIKQRGSAVADLKAVAHYERMQGVSIITPTHRGVERLERLLSSIVDQTLERSKIEVIIVSNGPEDGTTEKIKSFSISYPDIRLVHLLCPIESASAARNMGLDAVSMRYVTFIDDDDYISPAFLETLLEAAAPDRIVFAALHDFTASSSTVSRISAEVLGAVGGITGSFAPSAHSVRSILSMTCAKLAPMSMIAGRRFARELRSGEDVVFWAGIILSSEPHLYVPVNFEKAIYHREIREGSVSRRTDDFSFAITERLQVIKELQNIVAQFPEIVKNRLKDFIANRYYGQQDFIVSYLKKRPNEFLKFHAEAKKIGVYEETIATVRGKCADQAVISYCFPPSNDTSAIVVMKRVLSEGRPVHAISNFLGTARERNRPLLSALDGLLASHTELKAPLSWNEFPGIKTFAEEAASKVSDLIKHRGVKSIYTRALWIPSIFAGALIKAQTPAIRWVAEFSDPLLLDIHGIERPGSIPQEWLIKEGVLDMVRKAGVAEKVLDRDSLFLWAELIPFAIADELIFTNRQQERYMTTQDWVGGLASSIAARSRVSPHPTLTSEFYSIGVSTLPLNSVRVNIGYFGSFYATRGLSDVLDAIARLDDDTREKITLHIVSPEKESVDDLTIKMGLTSSVKAHNSLSYFDCLADYSKFDYLLVNDAHTKDTKSVNPYLPSKLSDYIGSNRPIWAIAEKGSALSECKLPGGSILTDLGDRDEYIAALKQISSKFEKREPAV